MRVGVIGAGPAGMTAAIFAARNGAEVTLLERNEKAGKKLYITGKGRCNVTNNSLPDDFLNNIVSNPKFCFSAINRFSPAETIEFLEKSVPLKTERGNRVFPVSDKSSDIIKAFTNMLAAESVKTIYNSKVSGVNQKDGLFHITTENNTYCFERLIIATGGLSYPSTGSTGSGYDFAKRLGHNIIEPVPALCAITLKNRTSHLEGLSLKNVGLKAIFGDKVFNGGLGEMLFTADGVSGPLALTLSSHINREKSAGYISIDLKPALTYEELDRRLLRDFSELMNRNFSNALDKLLPKKLIFDIINKSGIPEYKKINLITVSERRLLAEALKDFRLEIKSLDNIERAVVTAGGVSTKEINPNTMQSKLNNGLFFAGEIIDIDALTGGYNIQLAVSSGFLAGINSAI